MSLFDVLGGLLACYTALSIARGEVFAKSGAWGRSISRSEQPQQFWMIVLLYAGLSIALVLWF